MKKNARWTMWGASLLLVCSMLVRSQQNPGADGGSTSSATSQLPRLVKFSGTLKDGNGNPLAGVLGVTFALFSEQSGGDPLWLETQDVQADESGHYAVMLGATRPDGVPVELFASEQAHWLGIQPEGQPQQPRVMLVSVPYALKAADAETLGGKPASAYALATAPSESPAPVNERTQANAAISPSNSSQTSLRAATTGSGTANYIPRWTGSSVLGNSNIFQNATSKDIGIGTATPAATLDVVGTSLLRGSSATAFGLTVTSPSQFGEEIQGPITGVGAGLDFKTTGTEGKQWELLATGDRASQGVGKFNIRDVNTSTDVFTVDSTDTVNIGNMAVSGYTNTGELYASAASVGSFGMTSQGPVGIGSEFNKKAPTANLDVQGNGIDTLIGDPGCGLTPFAGIAFSTAGFQNCGNYSLVGDGKDTYIGAPSGNIYFRTNSNANTPMTITGAGKVGIGGDSPLEKLDVAGRVRSKNLAVAANAASDVNASSSNCLSALLVANSACDTPDMSLTETTGNVPVFITANINGVLLDSSGCVVANFGLVMDAKIIAVSNIRELPWDKRVSGSDFLPVTSVTLVSLQFPPPGSHTFAVQESDDTGECDNDTNRTVLGYSSNTSSNNSTRTLIVREL